MRYILIILIITALIGCTEKNENGSKKPEIIKVEGKTEKYSGSETEKELIKDIIKTGKKYESEYVVLWVEKKYMSENEAKDLLFTINKAIDKIKSFTGMALDKDFFDRGKIEFFAYYDSSRYHILNDFDIIKYRQPIAFLSNVTDGKAPIIYKAARIIAYKTKRYWLRAGLSSYLNSRMNDAPSFPTYGADIYELSGRLVENLPNFTDKMITGIGTSETPVFESKEARQIYNVLAGSFLRFLDEQVTSDMLMKIYSAEDPENELKKITGKDIKTWKSLWKKHLARGPENS